MDPVSQKAVRRALLALASTLPDTKRAFGTQQHTDPVRHLVCSASAWGGNPEKDALYLNVTPARNDGTTAYRLNVGEVPVDGFWSVTVYNADGYFTANPQNAYRSTTSPPSGAPTARSTSSSAGATAWCPTACPSRPVGTTS